MAVTLLYEPHESPLGTFREAAVYETLEEALMQAAWDELVAVNRWPESIIEGAHHGSPGWTPGARRRGRPVHDAAQSPAHEQDAKVLADFDAISSAMEVVRRHYVVHPDDAADPDLPAFGVPMAEPVERNERGEVVEWKRTGDPRECLAELKGLA